MLKYITLVITINTNPLANTFSHNALRDEWKLEHGSTPCSEYGAIDATDRIPAGSCYKSDEGHRVYDSTYWRP